MAATTIAFFGIRMVMSEADVEALENRSHAAIVSARKAGLEHYWGNFASPGESYLLFVGKLLGKLGVEDASELRFTQDQLSKIAADVSTRLSAAGITKPPALLMQNQPDD